MISKRIRNAVLALAAPFLLAAGPAMASKDKPTIGVVVPTVRIVAEDLPRSFGNPRALSDVSVALEPGKVHAFVGENGAGKSTLLKILAGAERPDSGRMVLDGQPYAPRSVTDATRRGVGLVFPGDHHQSVADGRGEHSCGAARQLPPQWAA